jgi:hypothetical protein
MRRRSYGRLSKALKHQTLPGSSPPALLQLREGKAASCDAGIAYEGHRCRGVSSSSEVDGRKIYDRTKAIWPGRHRESPWPLHTGGGKELAARIPRKPRTPP